MNRNDVLKFIALLTMTIDHIGAILLPQYFFLRLIGRISFPLFAYQLVVGFQNTKNRKRYGVRLFLFALLSQPVYFWLFEWNLNIGFTLLYSFFLLCFWEKDTTAWWVLVAVLLIPIYFVNGIMDYGLYGIVTVILFYIYSEKKKERNIGIISLNLIYGAVTGIWPQWFSLFALPLIGKKWSFRITLPRWLFYVYYPCHLALIGLLQMIFIGTFSH